MHNFLMRAVFLLCAAAVVSAAGMEDPHPKKEEGPAEPLSVEAVEKVRELARKVGRKLPD